MREREKEWGKKYNKLYNEWLILYNTWDISDHNQRTIGRTIMDLERNGLNWKENCLLVSRVSLIFKLVLTFIACTNRYQ